MSSKKKKKQIAPPFDTTLYYFDANPQGLPIKVSWDKITFNKGFITIEINRINYKKYIKNSSKELNYIKKYYVFKEIPSLEIVLSGKEILIVNEENLFYHIEFFESCHAYFNIQLASKKGLKRWNNYSKEYFRRNLPFLFVTKSLEKLSEICNEGKSSIIPVGEVVRNLNNQFVIHPSFLFKINNWLVWESTREAKASYIFPSAKVDLVYDYISGIAENKRETLFSSSDIQKLLSMKGRIYHSNYADWEGSLLTALT